MPSIDNSARIIILTYATNDRRRIAFWLTANLVAQIEFTEWLREDKDARGDRGLATTPKHYRGWALRLVIQPEVLVAGRQIGQILIHPIISKASSLDQSEMLSFFT
jgi:hypothetical protein